MITILRRFWESSTLTTWASLGVKTISLVVIFPLVLAKFDHFEIQVWYLVQSVFKFQFLFDFGFSSTFVRVIAYTVSGGEYSKVDNHTNGKRFYTKEMLPRIYGTMSRVYNNLSLILLILFVSLGSITLIKPVSTAGLGLGFWLVWMFSVSTAAFYVRGLKYASCLQGLGYVALVRRWEAIMGILSATSCVAIVYSEISVIYMILNVQFWVLLNTLRNFLLIRYINNKDNLNLVKNVFDREVFLKVWPSAWRSGIGVFLSSGIINLSGILYAQVASSKASASYLICVRLFQTLINFSNAPFYSKLPVFAKTYAQNKNEFLLGMLNKSMFLTLACYVAGASMIILFGENLLFILKSDVQLPGALFVICFALSFFFERVGAMYLQIHSLKNYIIWHFVNCMNLILILTFVVFLYNYLGFISFPVGMLIANLIFFFPYSSYRSEETINIKTKTHYCFSFFVPFVVLLVVIAIKLEYYL